jgi:hypothetical protein
MTSRPLRDGQDQTGKFAPGNGIGPRFTPGHKFATGRPPGAPNKPYDAGRELFFERHIESAIADRFCSLVAGIVGDLGGQDNLSNAQLQLIRRSAMISTHCEMMETGAAEGKPFDPITYGQLTGHLTRALKALGLKRQPRDVTPTLQDYLNAVRQPQPEEEKEESE